MRLPSAMTSLAGLLAAILVGLLVLPLLALALATSPSDLAAGLADPLFLPALGLSLRTTLVSLTITIALGTPLAWWLAHGQARLSQLVTVLVELPIVIPPAVVGVGLLASFGRRGLLGPLLAAVDVRLPFTSAAVVIAQVVVAAPFYVQAAAQAFREIDPELLVVARTLGASPTQARLRVALPLAWPGLVAGASLAWARALGEFGSTLLFAGNMSGRTQTMPLAIFSALESDLRLAIVLALVLAATGALVLLGLRALGARVGGTR